MSVTWGFDTLPQKLDTFHWTSQNLSFYTLFFRLITQIGIQSLNWSHINVLNVYLWGAEPGSPTKTSIKPRRKKNSHSATRVECQIGKVSCTFHFYRIRLRKSCVKLFQVRKPENIEENCVTLSLSFQLFFGALNKFTHIYFANNMKLMKFLAVILVPKKQKL